MYEVFKDGVMVHIGLQTTEGGEYHRVLRFDPAPGEDDQHCVVRALTVRDLLNGKK